jgi:hypothetical protein
VASFYFTDGIPHFLYDFPLQSGVCGVAYANKKFFFVEKLSDVIKVYDATAPYTRLEDLKVYGMQDPRDLVAAKLPTCSCLYVLDAAERRGGLIWKITLKHDGEKKLTEQYIQLDINAAGSLSIVLTPGVGLLMTSHVTSTLQVKPKKDSAHFSSKKFVNRLLKWQMHRQLNLLKNLTR